jgi:hypothetical protein
VAIVGLAYNSGPSRDEVRTYTEKLGLTFPTLMCSYATAQAYDVATYPTTFALNREKHIRYWMYGILVPEHWDNLIAEMLAADLAARHLEDYAQMIMKLNHLIPGVVLDLLSSDELPVDASVAEQALATYRRAWTQ